MLWTDRNRHTRINQYTTHFFGAGLKNILWISQKQHNRFANNKKKTPKSWRELGLNKISLCYRDHVFHKRISAHQLNTRELIKTDISYNHIAISIHNVIFSSTHDQAITVLLLLCKVHVRLAFSWSKQYAHQNIQFKTISSNLNGKIKLFHYKFHVRYLLLNPPKRLTSAIIILQLVNK